MKIFCILLGVNAQCLAYEVDNFTLRYKPLNDSITILDAEINSRLNHALQGLTKDKTSCNKSDVLSYVSEEFSGNIVGSIESWSIKNKKIEKADVDLEKSIYKSRSINDKILGGVLSAAGLEPSINLNGYFIGVDKLGHFFDQGYAQFLIAFKDGDGIEAALKRGVKQEESYLGWSTTGVKSYGDLSANYSGMMFYKNLTDGNSPYFICKNDRWQIAKQFSFKEYVNPSWDEAINCSEFNSESLKSVVNTNALTLEKGNPGKKFKCPVSEEKCNSFASIFPKEFLSHLISPSCRNTQSSSSSGEMCQQKLSTSLVSPSFLKFCDQFIGKQNEK
jgi:hypothetical protein